MGWLSHDHCNLNVNLSLIKGFGGGGTKSNLRGGFLF